MSIRVCTYNIHKGFSQFNRRMVIHELRDRLRALDVDLVFLQEVQGLHLGHAARQLARAAAARVSGRGRLAADRLRRQRGVRSRPPR